MPHDITKNASEIENVDWSTGTGSGQHYTSVRFGSGSSQASQSSGDICRICHCESDPKNPLLTPCYCAGSLKYVHQACLQQWLTASETNSCELCKFPFIMHTKIKPFNEWRSLDISGVERRRLCCSVLFHCAAALCVIWSLCVLIERAADDVKRGLIDWPFWTKLAVVTVGLTGGVVFMYIQCKAYLHLCHRWKARNRILLIQNAPEKGHREGSLHPSTNAQQNRSALSSQEPQSTSRATAASNAAQAICIAANSMMPSECVCLDNSQPDQSRLSHHNNAESGAMHHGLQRVDYNHSTSTAVRIVTESEENCPGGLSAVPSSQIVANIECSQSQHNYERDWALDDVVSQISSFRPCPQGSGSMTPFLDSIQNVLEHSQSSSPGSVNDVCGGSSSRHDLSTGDILTDTGREHDMHLSSFSGNELHKEPSINTCVSSAVANALGNNFIYIPTQSKRYSNSSIFLENRDILDDNIMHDVEWSDRRRDPDAYTKLNYRHSCVLTTPDSQTKNLQEIVGGELRRYSDTKLLVSDSDQLANPMVFKTPAITDDNNLPPPLSSSSSSSSPSSSSSTTTTSSKSNTVAVPVAVQRHSIAAAPRLLDVQLPPTPLTPLLVFDDRHINKKINGSLYRSVQTVDIDDKNDLLADKAANTGGAFSSSQRRAEQQMNRARLFFKSLPNLSSSCESLIKK